MVRIAAVMLLRPPAFESRHRTGDHRRIAETGADGQHAPAVDILHERRFAQTLHHGVVVHDDEGRLAAYFGNRLAEFLRQVEMLALPVAAGQVLATAVDRAAGEAALAPFDLRDVLEAGLLQGTAQVLGIEAAVVLAVLDEDVIERLHLGGKGAFRPLAAAAELLG